jgi:predicted PurR-regulated permease PerM
MRRLALFSFVALATLTAAFTVWELSQAVILLLLSLAVAAALAPIVDFWTARQVPRPLALALSYGLVVLVLAGLVYTMAGPLVFDLQGTTDELAVTYRQVKVQWPDGNYLQQTIAARLPTADLAGALGASNPSGLAQGLLAVALHALGTFGELVVIIILSIFWSANSQGFERLWLSLLPVDQRTYARSAWEAIMGGVGEQVRSDLVLSFLAIVLLLGGFHAMGLAHPTLPAAAGGLFRLVPLVGVILAVVTTVLAGIATDPLLAALAAIYMVAVLVLLETLVAPRLLRSRRYSALLVTLMVIALTDAYGLSGLLVAPAAAAGVQIFFEKLLGALEAAPAAPRKLAQVDERVAKLQLLLAEQGPDASPELVSVVDRLSRLVASAEGATP